MRRTLTRFRRHSLLLLALLLALAAVARPGVDAAQEHSRKVAASALGAYAVMRTINATISTAKEAELSVPLFGGLAAKPGMALDPIDETVARVSDALFLVMSLTAILALAFAPVASVGAVLAAAGFLGLWAASMQPSLRAIASLSRAAALSGTVLALVLPAAFAGGGWLGEYVTETRLAEATEDLRQAGNRDPATDSFEEEPGEGSAWWRFWSSGEVDASRADREPGGWFTEVIEDYTGRAETIVTSSIEIMAIYALRLVVLPAIVLGVLLVLLRATLPVPRAPG